MARTVDRTGAARLLGVTERTTYNLERKGMPALRAGKFDPEAITEWYQGYKESGGKPGTLVEAETRLKSAEAELKEMKLAQARGELIPVELVSNALSRIFSSVQAKLVGYNKRLIPQLDIPQKFWPEAITTADRILYEILDDLAEAKDVPRIVAESAAAAQVEDGAAPAAAPVDGEPVGRPLPKAKPRGQRRTRAVVHKSR